MNPCAARRRFRRRRGRGGTRRGRLRFCSHGVAQRRRGSSGGGAVPAGLGHVVGPQRSQTTVRLDERGMQAGQERRWSELCWSAQCSRCARRAFCGRLRRAATWSAMSAQAEASRSFWEAVAARGTQRKRVWFSAWSAVVDDSAQGWRVKPLGRARSARTREESTPSHCELRGGGQWGGQGQKAAVVTNDERAIAGLWEKKFLAQRV